MSLRKKTLLIITITLAGLIILLYASSRSILLQSFVLLENDDVYLTTERGLQALSNEIAAMTATAQDWATRRDSTAFVQSADPAYIETYLDDSTFIANNLNIVAFADRSGQLVYEQNFDLVTGQKKNITTGIAQHLQPGRPLLNLTGDSDAGGIVLLPTGPALVTAVPVTSGDQAPAAGVLILGRYLTEDEMQRMADTTQLLLSIYYYKEPKLPRDVMTARTHLSEQKRFFIQTIDAHNITGYNLLNDIYGSPALILRVSLSRRIYEEGQAGIWYFVLALIASGLVFCVMIMILLEQTVLSRLAKLNAGVNQIRNSHNLSLRVPASGKDELAQLGYAVNEMLAELKQSEEGERKQRLTAEALRHTSEALAASIQLEDTFRLIIEQLKLIVPYDRALIVMIEEERLRIVETSAFAGHDRLTGQTFADGDVPVFDDGAASEPSGRDRRRPAGGGRHPFAGLRVLDRHVGERAAAHALAAGRTTVSGQRSAGCLCPVRPGSAHRFCPAGGTGGRECAHFDAARNQLIRSARSPGAAGADGAPFGGGRDRGGGRPPDQQPADDRDRGSAFAGVGHQHRRSAA